MLSMSGYLQQKVHMLESDVVLTHADEEALHEILGQPTVQSLRSIDARRASQARLRELVDMRTREGLLLDPLQP